MLRKLQYNSHLLLMNYKLIYLFYIILFSIILNINQEQTVVYCAENDITSLQMENMVVTCETQNTLDMQADINKLKNGINSYNSMSIIFYSTMILFYFFYPILDSGLVLN